MTVLACIISALASFFVVKKWKSKSQIKNQRAIAEIKRNSELMPIFKIIIKINEISKRRKLTAKESYSHTICKNLIRSKIRNPVLRKEVYDLLEKKDGYFF